MTVAQYFSDNIALMTLMAAIGFLHMTIHTIPLALTYVEYYIIRAYQSVNVKHKVLIGKEYHVFLG